MRCTDVTADVIRDADHRVIACVGAARSMKTQTIVVWALRQWMLRGGPGTIGWFLGPELDRAFVLVEKFCEGEGDNPPVCPPELIRSFPSSKDAHDPTIEMIDGTTIQIKHMGAQGKNLTARGVVFAVATEMATSSSSMNFVRLRGRIVQSKGQLALDAVPEPRNWVRAAILDAAVTEADEIKEAKAKGLPANDATHRVVQLSQAINPWVDPAEFEAFYRDLHRIDPRMAAREAGGEWTDDRDPWIADFDAGGHVFDAQGRDPLDYLGMEDVTEIVSARWFADPHDHVIAVDVNARPHTALVGRFGVLRGQRPDVPANWHFVAVDELQLYQVDSSEASIKLAKYRDGLYAGAGVIIDATSMLARHNSGGSLNQRQNILPPEAYRSAGFEVRGPMRMKNDPSRFTDPGKFDSSLVVRDAFREKQIHICRSNCQGLIYALRNQMTEPDGITPDKQSNTVQDRKVAAFTDVLRYLLWPFFSLSPTAKTGAPPKVRVYG